MNTLETIFKRRSIRRYTPEIVKEEDIEIIVKAGMAAPSAHNSHPCYFLVIRDRELLDKIGGQFIYHQMLQKANAAIVLCADPALMLEDTGPFIVDDCSAAMENMLLGACELGLGAVWLGVHNKPHLFNNIKSWLEIPQGMLVHSIISLGYPQRESRELDRYQPERLFHDKWGRQKEQEAKL